MYTYIYGLAAGLRILRLQKARDKGAPLLRRGIWIWREFAAAAESWTSGNDIEDDLGAGGRRAVRVRRRSTDVGLTTSHEAIRHINFDTLVCIRTAKLLEERVRGRGHPHLAKV